MAHGEKFWEKVLAAVDGGQTQGEAAARFGVSVSAIQYWQSKRRQEPHAELLPVRVLPPASGVRLEIEVAGVIIRLPDGVRPEYVAELVRALRSC
jgi:hypothetical protein